MAHNPKVPGSSPGSATSSAESGKVNGKLTPFEAVKIKREQAYTLPVIYTAGGNTRARWHVSFYYDHPHTGEPHPFKLRGGINRIKDPDARMKKLHDLQAHYTHLLQTGWMPEMFSGMEPVKRKKYTTIEDCLQKVLEIKKTYQKADTSYPPFESKINVFTAWLRNNQLHHLRPDAITDNHIFDFLLYIMNGRKCSARTRNNYLTDISTAFDAMRAHNRAWCPENPCNTITKIPDAGQMHEPYNDKLYLKIKNYIQEHDPVLYRFCRFFIYLGFRPVEAVRVRISDINLAGRYVLGPAKNMKTGARQTKTIQAIHLPDFELLNLDEYPQNYYVFSATGRPSAKGTTRDFFTSRFARVKKALGLSRYQSMYALRHTFLIMLFDSMTTFEEIRELKKLTGHKTWAAFEAYIEKYRGERAKDFSERIRAVF